MSSVATAEIRATDEAQQSTTPSYEPQPKNLTEGWAVVPFSPLGGTPVTEAGPKGKAIIEP